MSYAYNNCNNLTAAVCGDKVTDMRYVYSGCTNLTTAVCGPNVTNIAGAYFRCSNLTGSPVCGDNVAYMGYVYSDCINLTGSPVCGNNVCIMQKTYYNCTNLTGSPVCGPNVTDMNSAYRGCPNIQGNSYFYSPNISSIGRCFDGRNTSNMLNIYVQKNSTTMNTCLTNDDQSLIWAPIEWTNDSANNRYYNTSANIYIYPVANVYQAKVDNGD